MNSVILIGRLVADPKSQSGASGKPFCRFRLAVDKPKKEDGADFITCVTFGRQAETLDAYKRKGDQIGVQGRITTGSYTNKEGQKVYTTEVIAERVEFLTNGNSGGASDSRPEEDRYREPEDYHGYEAADDDIPF